MISLASVSDGFLAAYLTTNPCIGIRRNKEVKLERYVEDILNWTQANIIERSHLTAISDDPLKLVPSFTNFGATQPTCCARILSTKEHEMSPIEKYAQAAASTARTPPNSPARRAAMEAEDVARIAAEQFVNGLVAERDALRVKTERLVIERDVAQAQLARLRTQTVVHEATPSQVAAQLAAIDEFDAAKRGAA